MVLIDTVIRNRLFYFFAPFLVNMMALLLAAATLLTLGAASALRTPADFEVTSLPGLNESLPFKHYAGYIEATVCTAFHAEPNFSSSCVAVVFRSACSPAPSFSSGLSSARPALRLPPVHMFGSRILSGLPSSHLSCSFSVAVWLVRLV